MLIEAENKLTTADFHVVDTTHKNLLSGSTAITLGLITLPARQLNSVEKKLNESEKFNSKQIPTRLRPLIESYKNTLFSNKIGKMKNYQVQLHINKNIPPVAQRERRIPFALRERVKQELEKLEKQGIVEDVTCEPTPWLSPLVIVPKGKSSIRVCLDMRNANVAIERTRYQTPTVDDLIVKLSNAKVFSKLDLRSAFHQLELTPESRYITAFQSEDRIRRFTRLIFGANSAAEELQHAIRTLLAGIEGAINIADDILVFGENAEAHDKAFKKVLQRLAEKGLTLNLEKCLFHKESLEYFGFIFSKEGVKPSPTKMAALKNVDRPRDVKAVRSFLGLTNYLKRFIDDYSSITYPLRCLTKENSDFVWTEDCEKCFQKLKNCLTDESCIAYFNEKHPTFLYCDASPVGISAILLQRSPNGESKVVSYASRSLTETEQRYSQIERECLAVVYACERHRLYLLGRNFTIYTDQKALVKIFSNPQSTVPLRIERMTLRISGYDFELKFVKGTENISDYTSRHPHIREVTTDDTENYVNLVTMSAVPNALSLEDIKTETMRDPVLKILVQIISENHWYKLKDPDKYEIFNDFPKISELRFYEKIKNELTVNTERNIILKGNRIVVPKPYQNIVVKLAHQGHIGIQKTKALLRSKVFFVGMDKLVEKEITNCLPCQATGKPKPQSPITSSVLPSTVWHTVNVDFLGPLPNGTYVFVVIDQRSRYEYVSKKSHTMPRTYIFRIWKP